jgi:hypothetical protein
MARARNIKPGFFTNDELVELPFYPSAVHWPVDDCRS